MLFFETFDKLSADGELKKLFEDVDVEKLIASKDSGDIHIYIRSSHLISRSNIRKMEELLNGQLFLHTGRKAVLKPCFTLTDQKDAKKLYSMYKDSILEELAEDSIVACHILESAQVTFSDTDININVIDSCITREKAPRLKEFLYGVFTERFGYDIRVKLNYTEPKEKKRNISSRAEDNPTGGYISPDGDNSLDGDSSLAWNNLPDSDRSSTRDNSMSNGISTIRNNSTNGGNSYDEDMERHSLPAYEYTRPDSGSVNGYSNGSGNGYSNGTGNGIKNVSGNNGNSNGVKNGNSNGFKNGTGNGFKNGNGNGSAGKAGNNNGAKSKFYKKGSKLPNDPSIVYGRNFEGHIIPICDIIDEIGEIVIRGRIIKLDSRPIGNDKCFISFVISDYTDSIKVKLYCPAERLDEILEVLKVDSFYSLKGIAQMDNYDHDITIGSVVGIREIPDFTTVRTDKADVKRVELHAHTMMSDMDAVTDVTKLIRRAFDWGHPAIAITDHGVVQAFPDASHAINPKNFTDAELKKRAEEFKVIYGMEAYLVDDIKEVVTNPMGQSLNSDYVVFDIETTGFSQSSDRIIEIGAVKLSNGEIADRFSSFINPGITIPYNIEQLTGINDVMVADAPSIDKVLPEFLDFCRGCTMVAHNASFDMGFIQKNARVLGLEAEFTVVDTVGLARILLPDLNRYKLNYVAKALNVSLENHHRAVDDAEAAAEIFLKLLAMLPEKGVESLSGIDRLGRMSAEAIRKLPVYHAILLVKNDIGRVNLYKMVSLSHIEYYNKRPRIPKSLLMECREGLLVGSACEAGEVYRAVLSNQSHEQLARLVNFYDYLEIQPLGNNEFLIRSDRSDDREINTRDDLININNRIIELGREYNKPVVATCDVHFLDPEDEVFRRIILAGQGYKDADMQASLYFRTTEEMLEEFSYLGREKAEEVVITNTNLIASRIEKISPVRPDKCPPKLPNSEEELKQICYDKAHSIYGEALPAQVEKRLEHELKSIISNGFAVMYMIAQKLVKKSNEDGYLVGSRGSVGSSFVATLAGITEVNPLPPHYYCPSCHYTDFDSDEVKRYSGSSGCDMPDRKCPVCGAELLKEGHDIPFETFLGFDGDKEPDIDLNFSGEYQSMAHDYTEVIFGEGHTFRAGTIGTLADKTAYGYVKNYFEERGIHKRNAEIDRLVAGLVGVKRTTGQHPGGIVVLPHGENIYSFTPVQHPANDMTSKTVTTHFDYHSIDHNLLKLDILGHDDPTMIRMLEDLTGYDARKIHLDDKQVLSLFHDTSALGIKPSDIDGCELGCLGIPEFGTDFVMQMVKEAKPKTFSDLVRISGLSHGTDVWLGNAQTLIKSGTCTLATAICTRDDMLIYLMGKGMDPGISFKIMESVRKGKGLTPEMEEAMLAAEVPDWYIESCKKIKYMFPKAHAAAYVMMAFRIAYFKVYYPLAYYAAYFSIRASAFNYELMCFGKEKLEQYISDYKRRMNSLSKKEQDTYKDMRIVQEMYARGYSFTPIDIYTAKAHKFQIIGNKLMPSLSTIDGLGDKAADAVVEAVKEGRFLSLDDFKNRCKVSSTVVDNMVRMGLLSDLPMTNQMSLLDFLE